MPYRVVTISKGISGRGDGCFATKSQALAKDRQEELDRALCGPFVLLLLSHSTPFRNPPLMHQALVGVPTLFGNQLLFVGLMIVLLLVAEPH